MNDAPLDPAALQDEATAVTGLYDFGPLTYRPALELLIDQLNAQAHLTPCGRAEVRKGLLSGLTTRLRLYDARAPRPPARSDIFRAPVFIIGLPRTGSTLLHSLLACHPALHAIRLWELMNPVSPPGVSDATLINDTQKFVCDHFLAAPALQRIHPTSAQSPEECEYLMTADFRNAVLGLISYRVPGYASWLLEQDITCAYRMHREQLGRIVDRRPAAPGARLLLKSPSHVWHLPSLAAVYPDARFVVLRRDLAEATASACSLALHARRKRSDRACPTELGRQLSEATRLGTARLAEFMAAPPAGIDGTHVDFEELTSDPEAVAHRVFEFLGLPVTPAVRHGCRDYLERHPRRAHVYTRQAFGITS